jgi:hypothetical protein
MKNTLKNNHNHTGETNFYIYIYLQHLLALHILKKKYPPQIRSSYLSMQEWTAFTSSRRIYL